MPEVTPVVHTTPAGVGEPTHLPRRVVLISIAAAIGGFLFGFDTAIINGAVDAITKTFDLSSAMLGAVVAVTLGGAAGGAAAAGWIADRLGRRPAMLISAVVFCASSVGCALSSSPGALVGWRLTTGIAVGMASVLAPLYISEIAPPRDSGLVLAAANGNCPRDIHRVAVVGDDRRPAQRRRRSRAAWTSRMAVDVPRGRCSRRSLRSFRLGDSRIATSSGRYGKTGGGESDDPTFVRERTVSRVRTGEPDRRHPVGGCQASIP